MTIKLYNQTGFNSVDIPDSPHLFDGIEPFKTYENYNLVQSEYLAYIRLDDISPEQARQIDYCLVYDDGTIKNINCYTINSFKFMADGICEFELLLDAYNTIGGFGEKSGNQILSGSANRLTVSLADDNANFYTLDEPFKPSEKLKIEFKKPFEQSLGGKLFIEVIAIPPKIVSPQIYTGVSLPEGIKIQSPSNAVKNVEGCISGETAIIQSQGSGQEKTTGLTYCASITPKLRKLKETVLTIYNPFNQEFNLINLGTRIFDKSKIEYSINVEHQGQVNGDLIQDMREQGMDNNVIAFWLVPSKYIFSVDDKNYDPTSDSDYGGANSITSQKLTSILSITPHQTYNNKSRYSQSLIVKLFNPASGDSIDKLVSEIIDPGQTPSGQSYNATICEGADIRPDGSPIAGFKYINGTNQGDTMCQIVSGAKWREIPLAATGLSGESIRQSQLNIEKNRNKFSSIGQGFFGGLQVIGGIGLIASGVGAGVGAGMVTGGAGTLVSSVGGYISKSNELRDEQDLLNRESVSAATQINIGSSSLARELGKNEFYIMVSSYSDNDINAYDTFLTKFGYNVGNKKINNLDFFSRPAFNYIRINDITIRSISGNINLINKVKEQLKLGVRIWHKLPTPEDMEAGGNR